MPISEMILKDAGVALQMTWDAIRFKRRKTILAYPHYPSRGSTLYRIAQCLGWGITNKFSRSWERAIFWEYATVREGFEALEGITKTKVINLESRDISKDVVDEQMQEAFGYSTRIDPTAFEGIAVRKSLKNAVHDGRSITCPCTPEPGFIYQRLIDSSVSENEVVDLRIPVVGGTIPLLYQNFRMKTDRFKNVPDRAELTLDIESQLSTQEIERILSFCSFAGLSFCELDVLRDQSDGRIYIVDANNTPQGPPKNLDAEAKKVAIECLSTAFENAFIKA
ncbi:MAG: hypothetical protein RLP15_00290 [Cryomorphaceae bacterium]